MDYAPPNIRFTAVSNKWGTPISLISVPNLCVMQITLHDASLISNEGAEPIAGDALAELVRQYNTANAIIKRINGVRLD
jgi:hypothetical protein